MPSPFLAILAFRTYNALAVRTFFNPDEYWQSLEVAHEFVFGYGYLTWEWEFKIRGFTYPMIFATAFQALKSLNMDTPELVILVPKFLQAVSAATGDYFTYKFGEKLFGPKVGKWALICSLMNHFNYFCAVRTLGNSVETTLTVAALYYWSWTGKERRSLRRFAMSVGLASLACVMRPTSIILWAVLGLFLLFRSRRSAFKIILVALLIGLSILAISILIDSLFYNELTFTIYNFFKLNVIHGISSFYGTHPWHCIPPLFQEKPHRDIPIATMTPSSSSASSRTKNSDSSIPSSPSSWVKAVVVFLALTNAASAWYLGTVHQRGVVDVMGFLRKEVRRDGVDGVVFLMPCHSTPFYSHLHANVPMRFLTCSPPLTGAKGYVDEADVFYENPGKFLERYFDGRVGNKTVVGMGGKEEVVSVPGQEYTIQRYKWPSHVVFFEALKKDLVGIFDGSNYKECARFFNSHFIDDKRRVGHVVVYCRPKSL
ncbi:Alg9-like mannosyltransferase family-domain-containing protein [Chytridium lagenaria]|nr:Alg9-like mannosyltransferase family-domain-containing protein [Chytridium lagenaria]